ncbi:hypothetical protein PoB_004813500 [Plakobranchus ocellatus]|uniref:Uncharacterized protein n=1 Tax=Plakobranchus ocellatus TaxID=259542 RepID=A0AAV4BR95_9GAST|nr:hypothetical protein PoB_004813500 [Plakobranchus ocellatus]
MVKGVTLECTAGFALTRTMVKSIRACFSVYGRHRNGHIGQERARVPILPIDPDQKKVSLSVEHNGEFERVLHDASLPLYLSSSSEMSTRLKPVKTIATLNCDVKLYVSIETFIVNYRSNNATQPGLTQQWV